MNDFPEINEVAPPFEQGAEMPDITYLETVKDGFMRFEQGALDVFELANLVLATANENQKTKTAITEGNLRKLEESLNSGEFHDRQVALINDDLDPLLERVTQLHELETQIECYDFADLQYAFADNFITVGSVKDEVEKALTELVVVINMMLGAERDIEQSRRELWAMRPELANLSISQKLMSQDEERTIQEVALLKQRAQLRVDADRLIVLAGNLRSITQRHKYHAITASDRATVSEVIQKAPTWSLQLGNQKRKKIHADIQALETMISPLVAQLEKLNTLYQNKRRSPDADKQIVVATLGAIYDRIERALEQEQKNNPR